MGSEVGLYQLGCRPLTLNPNPKPNPVRALLFQPEENLGSFELKLKFNHLKITDGEDIMGCLLIEQEESLMEQVLLKSQRLAFPTSRKNPCIGPAGMLGLHSLGWYLFKPNSL